MDLTTYTIHIHSFLLFSLSIFLALASVSLALLAPVSHVIHPLFAPWFAGDRMSEDL
jgi:hypothetical protein